ncbi:MAG: Holliday junction resolvase Hjc, partial [Candidatus Nanoarchaeia archaeon]
MPRIGTKRKGTKAERELFHLFWESGWGCARVAGSGSTQRPSSDLVAANKEQKRLLAIECKAIGDNAKYFEPEELEQLAQFAAFMGAEPWFAMRFNRE